MSSTKIRKPAFSQGEIQGKVKCVFMSPIPDLLENDEAALGSTLNEVCTIVHCDKSHRRNRRRHSFIVMNKLEKVALRSAKRTGKPLVLVLNNVHLFNNDDDGRNMLLQLQQHAEAWAASGE